MTQKENVQSVNRALCILEILAEHDGISLTDLSKKSELNKTTVHRLLSTLISTGYVEQDSSTGHYGLTFKLFELGNKKVENIDSFKVARGLIRELSNKVEETVHLVVEDNREIVYIDKVEPNNLVFRMSSKIGRRVPMYSTAVGKSILSHYPNEIVEQVWDESDIKPLTSHTITNFSSFMEEIEQIRSQGYAIDNEENEIGIYCVASVFYNHMEEVEGAISISIPMTRLVKNNREYYIEKVLEYSKKISHSLGKH